VTARAARPAKSSERHAKFRSLLVVVILRLLLLVGFS
jgi:hypothetical protein